MNGDNEKSEDFKEDIFIEDIEKENTDIATPSDAKKEELIASSSNAKQNICEECNTVDGHEDYCEIYIEELKNDLRAVISFLKAREQDVIKLSEYHTKLFKKGTNTFGLLAWWDFDWCIFLEYFCIKDRFRGKGYSYDLFAFIFNMRKLIILEVDKTNNGLLSFYKSQGFVLNDNYIYKPINLSLDYTNNSNLALMSYPRKISKNEFESFILEQANPKYNQYRK